MAHPPDQPRGAPQRIFLLITGCLSLALGLVGAVLPLLPTTPFVILAAACFASAWPAMHRRMAESRLLGPIVRSHPGGRFIPPRTKIGAILFTLGSIGATIVFAVEAPWLRLTLAALALGVTAFLLWMPSAPRPPDEA
ncbi:MAG: YbaN family protein [Planctomycetota bacterium]|nr:YbaN family protein [Planctomycetota bacterium]